MTTTNVGDNAFAPGMNSTVYSPDQLIAGNLKIETETKVITGAAAYLRGTVMGKVTLGAVTSAAKAGGNTGTGTCTVDVATPRLAYAQAGVYTVRCTAAAANNGTFELKDPRGRSLGNYVMAAGALTISNQIKFALADGGVDFIVGDGFDVTVAVGSGAYKKAVATAVDGSQTPSRILVDDIDVTGGDKNGGLYSQIEANLNKLVYDASFSASDIQAAFENTNIFVVTGLSNAAPS